MAHPISSHCPPPRKLPAVHIIQYHCTVVPDSKAIVAKKNYISAIQANHKWLRPPRSFGQLFSFAWICQEPLRTKNSNPKMVSLDWATSVMGTVDTVSTWVCIRPLCPICAVLKLPRYITFGCCADAIYTRKGNAAVSWFCSFNPNDTTTQALSVRHGESNGQCESQNPRILPTQPRLDLPPASAGPA